MYTYVNMDIFGWICMCSNFVDLNVPHEFLQADLRPQNMENGEKI